MESKKVLSIEDNTANRKIIFDLLTSQGYNVVEACDGKEGLKKAKTENPAVILLDIQLPEMDGYQVMKALAADSLTQNIPVIILSSYAMPGDSEKGYAAGASAYLTKPYNFAELLDSIKKALA